MADILIQQITIISTQTVESPKPHTVYVIQVSTPTRTWTAQRRYSDFLALHVELKSSVGKEPPGKLPSKGWGIGLGFGGRIEDDKTIRERRVVLEEYLRLMLTSKDNSWRQSYGFKDFLSVPSSSTTTSGAQTGAGSNSHVGTWTAQSWMIEHNALQGILRSARSSLLKRDALATMGDAVSSRSAGVEAKRILKDVDSRIKALDDALTALTLGQGEKKRREEMVQSLKVDREGLGRMAEAGIRTSTSAFKPTSNSAPSSTTNSAFGLGAGAGGGAGTAGPAGGSMNSLPGGFPAHVQSGRVFGSGSGLKSAPQETSETRPLDDRGLLQLQVQQMDNQDESLKELSKILQRQKNIGDLIHQEIGEQNDLLDEVESGIDKTGRKLGKTKRQLNRLG